MSREPGGQELSPDRRLNLARVLILVVLSVGSAIFWLDSAFRFLPPGGVVVVLLVAVAAYYVGGRLRLLVPRRGLFGEQVRRVAEMIQAVALVAAAVNVTVTVLPPWATSACLVVVALGFVVKMVSSASEAS